MLHLHLSRQFTARFAAIGERADPHGGFKNYRICHHSNDVCCRGFWDRHKNEFQLGQIAQRLGMVEFVNVDTLNLPDQKTEASKHENCPIHPNGRNGNADRT